jgi:hypothetical protein
LAQSWAQSWVVRLLLLFLLLFSAAAKIASQLLARTAVGVVKVTFLANMSPNQ